MTRDEPATLLGAGAPLDHRLREIADLTGVREGTVRSRVSRGLAALRQTLGTEQENDDG